MNPTPVLPDAEKTDHAAPIKSSQQRIGMKKQQARDGALAANLAPAKVGNASRSRPLYDEPPAASLTRAKHNVGYLLSEEVHQQVTAANEDDNVAVTAADTAVRAGESTLRTGKQAYQAHRQRKAAHSRQGSNRISRWRQKQAYRQRYAAGRTGNVRHTAGRTARRTSRQAARATPKAKLALLGVLGLMLVMIMSTVSSCVPLTQAAINSIVIGTYPATEEDVLAAERAYAAMEKDLQKELEHYAARHPGYDEYHIEAQDIGHDPYALMAIISAYFDGQEWTVGTVYPVLEKYFALQYILTEDVQTETRYRTEKRTGHKLVTDPDTGETRMETYTYEVEVPYEYTICQVTLVNRNLSHLPVYSMSHHTMGMYALYMSTLGNMPDLFARNPYASQLKDPMLYDIPEDVLAADADFAALIKEAEKYIGYPYVWGGASPETSFDCSGFVSYVLSISGVRETGRLGATGLWGICREVSAQDVRPGDLIFFEGTMGPDEPGITHVGIYVGDQKMLHCGNPIGYADLTDAYWRKHFYAYGRY